MEDDVDAAGQLGDELAIADVALDEPHGPVGQGPGEVCAPAPHEVVEHDDLLGAGPHELVGDVRAHSARSAGDQRAFAVHGLCTHAQ
jgi:hypothetical protein